jgi:hypothetical protein
MPSLIIQDAFAPYYADRKRFPVEPGPSTAGMTEKAPPPQDIRPAAKPATKADKTTEH